MRADDDMYDWEGKWQESGKVSRSQRHAELVYPTRRGLPDKRWCLVEKSGTPNSDVTQQITHVRSNSSPVQ